MGNLTLTGYNSEYSDRSFGEKRDMEGGFKQSPLKLNEGLSQLEEWKTPLRIDAETRRVCGAGLDWSRDQLRGCRAAAKRLRLSLNMRFTEVNDPKGLCKDVTSIGRWGNGDVEVGLSTLDELPYIIGLERQSLELQLGSSSEN